MEKQNKEHQKKLLTEIMEADQKNGLYDISGVNKQITMAQQTYGEFMRSNPPIPELTALEWYYEQTVVQGKTNYYELFEQAKQMEKERHDKWNEFLNAEKTLGVSDVKTIERIQWYYNQYFKETYEK